MHGVTERCFPTARVVELAPFVAIHVQRETESALAEGAIEAVDGDEFFDADAMLFERLLE